MYWEHKPLLEFPWSTDFVADKWVDSMDYLTLCHSQSQKPKIRVKLIIVIRWIHLTWAWAFFLYLGSRRLNLPGNPTPSADVGELKHEHYHRYFFALQFCDKKEVLDVGSGEVYGSALLGIVAQNVFGVDLSPEALARASRNYGRVQVSFTGV